MADATWFYAEIERPNGSVRTVWHRNAGTLQDMAMRLVADGRAKSVSVWERGQGGKRDQLIMAREAAYHGRRRKR